MTPTKQVRWQCPTGEHPGVLASTRPPLDSLVRYCLPCSTQAGKLVSRVAPSLERKREAAAAAQAAKAKAKREREARAKAGKERQLTARYTVEGTDLRDEFDFLCQLKVFGGKKGKLYRNPPEFVISKRSYAPQSRYGFAEPWRNRITISTWPSQTLADARETLCHELVHIHVGQDRESGAWHGPTFKETLRLAMKEAYKVDPLGLPGNVYHGRYAAALRKKETNNNEGEK